MLDNRYEYILREGFDGRPLKVLQEYQYTILCVINNVRQVIPRAKVLRQKSLEAVLEDIGEINA